MPPLLDALALRARGGHRSLVSALARARSAANWLLGTELRFQSARCAHASAMCGLVLWVAVKCCQRVCTHAARYMRELGRGKDQRRWLEGL